jgi:hypothetical protein
MDTGIYQVFGGDTKSNGNIRRGGPHGRKLQGGGKRAGSAQGTQASK